MIISLLGKIDRGLEKTAKGLLVFEVLLILFLSVITIVIRWFGIAFLWLDPLVRHLVFIAVFLGGTIATGRGTNICIDIIGTYFRQKNNHKVLQNIHRVIYLVSTLTIIWLIVGSTSLITVEREFGQDVFLGIHSSVLVAIIPIGFSLIAYRFFYKFIESCTTLPTSKVQE